MSLYYSYPEPQILKRNELATLNFLLSNVFINKHFHDLASQANIHFYSLQGKSNAGIDFHAKLDLVVERKVRRVYVGAVITSKDGEKHTQEHDLVSYYLAVSDRAEEPKRLLRKYHFDFVGKSTNTKQPQPIFHLQYGGKLPEFLINDGLDDEGLHSWLSTPRLIFYPVTLALLLDIAFCEFVSETTRKLVETSEWRALIKKNEDLVIKPYYEEMRKFLYSSDYNNNCLARDHCYGR